MKEGLLRYVNRAIEAIANTGPVAGALDRYIREYAGQATFVDTHSGFTATVVETMDRDHLPPLQAVVFSARGKKGAPLTEKKKTAIYVNTALGGGLELVARFLSELPFANSLMPGLKNTAQVLYDAADWDLGGGGGKSEITHHIALQQVAASHRAGKAK